MCESVSEYGIVVTWPDLHFFNIWSQKCPLAFGTVSYWLSTSHSCPLLTLYTALSHRNAQLSQLDLSHTINKTTCAHNNFLWWKIDTAKSRWLSALFTLLRMCPRFRRWDHAHSTELTHLFSDRLAVWLQHTKHQMIPSNSNNARSFQSYKNVSIFDMR